jgi:hypothetical protein
MMCKKVWNDVAVKAHSQGLYEDARTTWRQTEAINTVTVSEITECPIGVARGLFRGTQSYQVSQVGSRIPPQA